MTNELRVVWDDSVPDTTYFTLSDVAPRLKSNVLTLYDGEGTRRHWGRPAVWSTVVLESPDLVAVHVGFAHKHRGGQGWFYYRPSPETGEWTRVTWASLSTEERQRVLEAYEERAPSWAKVPGKIGRKSPRQNGFVALKVVRIREEKFVSLYDPLIEYEIGRTYREKAQPHHGGGYYAHLSTTPEELLEKFIQGGVYTRPDDGEYAVIESEFWGRRVYYDAGGNVVSFAPWCTPKKVATTYFRPKRVLVRFRVEEGQVVQKEFVADPLPEYPAPIEE